MIDDCFDCETDHNQVMNSKTNAGRKIGYVRVSDKDQTEALQLDALNLEGCDLIFTDHGVSGGKVARPALDQLMGELAANDTLVVWKLDRLESDSKMDLVFQSVARRGETLLMWAMSSHASALSMDFSQSFA